MPLPSPDELLSAHRLYDQYVDVVSAFEWLFTATKEMPSTVKHFERFPKLTGHDGEPATPDFTVLFEDGSGIVGEIARIALPEESIESLCGQLMRYDHLESLPSSPASTAAVEHLDVMLLVPMELGTATVQRVIRERLQDEEDDYAPHRAPCVVQYAPVDDKYVFQRRPDPENGRLHDGDRDPGLGAWLHRDDFNAPARGFARLKTERPFMNDPVPALYLAAQLWTRVLATRAASAEAIGDYTPLVLRVSDIVADLRNQYGRGRSADVRRAMEILVAVRAAEFLREDQYRVAWGDLAHQGGEDVSEALARRTENPPAKGPIGRLREAYEDLGLPDPFRDPIDQTQLFDPEELDEDES